ATEILPWIVAIQGSYQSISERFEDGLISREASKLYEIIEAQQGIDTRSLRAAAGMKAKEQKKYFDNALVELQASMDIVISGVHERINKDGTKSGWNSTSFETMDHWVKNAGI